MPLHFPAKFISELIGFAREAQLPYLEAQDLLLLAIWRSLIAAIVVSADRDWALVRPSLSLRSRTGEETCLQYLL